MGPSWTFLAAEARELGQPEASAEGDDDQRVIAAARQSGAVGGGDEGVHLLVREEGPRDRGRLLARDGQDLSDGVGVFGVTVGSEAEEGVDGGQTGVAARHAVVPVDLEVVEEPGDQLGVEVGKVEVAGVLAGPLPCEGEQEPEGVPVGVDGVDAGASLTVEAAHEERLEGGGERAHCG